jgi:hypothetical protein
MKERLLELLAELPEEHLAAMLEHAGIDVAQALAAGDDSVQKDPDEWEQIKAQPRKKSNIAKGKPKEVAIGSIKGHRSKLPKYLEEDEDEQGDGMGIGD